MCSSDLLLEAWRAKAEPVARVCATALACSDLGDQKFIDLAVCAGADALVSKDRALLALRRRAARSGLKIVSPAPAPAVLGFTPDGA